MLILLLAAGNGFKNGMESNFFYMAKNTVMLYPGRTTMPYAGFQKGRQLNFKAEDIDYMEMEIRRIAKVEQYTPIFNIWNGTLTYKRENDVSSLCGVRPGYEVMRSLSIERGRFLNEIDDYEEYIKNCLYKLVDNNKMKVDYYLQKLLKYQGKLESIKLNIDSEIEKIRNLLALKLEKNKLNLKRYSTLLEAYNTDNTLKRGYSIVIQDDHVVTSKKKLKKDDFNIKFIDGTIKAKEV